MDSLNVCEEINSKIEHVNLLNEPRNEIKERFDLVIALQDSKYLATSGEFISKYCTQ